MIPFQQCAELQKKIQAGQIRLFYAVSGVAVYVILPSVPKKVNQNICLSASPEAWALSC